MAKKAAERSTVLSEDRDIRHEQTGGKIPDWRSRGCSAWRALLALLLRPGLCPRRPGCSLLLPALEVVVLHQNLVDHPEHARADGDGTDGPPG